MVELILRVWREKGLKWPSAMQALAFATTELGEALELLLERDGGWTRNNPSDKEKFTTDRFEQELADIIMMVQVAGMDYGLDPVARLYKELESKVAGVAQ